MAFPAAAPAGENYARSGLPISAPNLAYPVLRLEHRMQNWNHNVWRSVETHLQIMMI